MRSISTLIDFSIKFYIEKFSLLARIWFPYAIIATLPQLYIQVSDLSDFSNVSMLGILSVCSSIMSALCLAITTYIAASPEKYSIGHYLQLVLSRLGSLVWVYILVSFFVILGFILLIIPGIIASIWLSFAFYVVLFETERGLDALKKSKEYIRGNSLNLLARLIVPSIEIFVILAVVSTVSEMTFHENSTIVQSVIITFLSTLLASPIFAIYYCHTYLDFRALYEQKQQSSLTSPTSDMNVSDNHA
jgi:peroxiredoxin family protein